MKKALFLIICTAIALTFTACGEPAASESTALTSSIAEANGGGTTADTEQTSSVTSGITDEPSTDEASSDSDAAESTSDEYYTIPEGYTLPFGEEEFGTYKSRSYDNTVTVSREGDKIRLVGNFSGYTFDLSFNDIERFDLPCENGNTILACYRVTDSARTIYFNEYNSEQNEVAYTHLTFDSDQLYINYGDSVNDILDKQ